MSGSPPTADFRISPGLDAEIRRAADALAGARHPVALTGAGLSVEIHGNHRLLRCIGCHARFEPDAIDVDRAQLPPRCPQCGGIVKGDIVVFGEPIPADVLRACFRAVAAADCMLVAGTSATVYPAAEFPLEVLRAGGVVIEVNPEESELTSIATIALRGPGGPVLSRLLAHTAALAERGAA